MTRTPLEIQEYLDNLSNQIKELEQLKQKAEKISFKKSRECCPDVCKTIDRSIYKLDDDLMRAKREKDKILRLVETSSSVFHMEESERSSLEKQALRKAKRVEILIMEQITSLKNLKSTLSEEKVCDCK